jgi:hypothetical protein
MGKNEARKPQAGDVIDIYARVSYAVNGETIKVDDQVEMGSRGGRAPWSCCEGTVSGQLSVGMEPDDCPS